MMGDNNNLKTKTRKRFCGVLVFSLFTACGLVSCKDTTEPTPKLEMSRLENLLFACKSSSEVAQFLKKYPVIKQKYFGLPANAPDSLLAQALFNNTDNPSLQSFKNQLDSIFDDGILEAQLSEGFTNIKAEFPDFKAPKIVTMVTGFLGKDLYVSDTLVIIGLDYFGGKNARYRPNSLYNYQLKRYQKEYLAASIIFVLSDKYSKNNPADKTFLADMVGYGKAFEFTKNALPNVSDTLILGYSQKQLDDVYAAQNDIWAYFLDRKLLYQIDPTEKYKFLDERPATPEINTKCPGGIGRWVGWRLVAKFRAENTGVSLKQLMQNPDAPAIFAASKYRGQPDEPK